jgi:hypothetical protein
VVATAAADDAADDKAPDAPEPAADPVVDDPEGSTGPTDPAGDELAPPVEAPAGEDTAPEEGGPAPGEGQGSAPTKPAPQEAPAPKPAPEKPGTPKPGTEKPPAEKPAPKPAKDPEELIAQARQAQLAKNYGEAYRLAAEAYSIGKSAQALQLMGVAACKLGDAGKAAAAHKKMSADKKTALESVCEKEGVKL